MISRILFVIINGPTNFIVVFLSSREHCRKCPIDQPQMGVSSQIENASEERKIFHHDRLLPVSDDRFRNKVIQHATFNTEPLQMIRKSREIIVIITIII